ncbi:MAG: hypothetical protein SW833_13305 [Cyanobacteriota bacterium]|nr:hypothetical protein [Cyanobacteriota bacterium]
MATSTAKASERYPTESEIQQMNSELSRSVQRILSGELRHHLEDYRTEEEKKSRQVLVEAWSKVNPSIAPFLGMWSGYGQTLSIYPSTTPGRVCVLEGGEGSFYGFTTGTVLSESEIRTRDRRVIVRSENYLGIVGIYNGKPHFGGEFPFRNPRPLPVPSQAMLPTVEDETSGVESAIGQFNKNEAGCTAALPGAF